MWCMTLLMNGIDCLQFSIWHGRDSKLVCVCGLWLVMMLAINFRKSWRAETCACLTFISVVTRIIQSFNVRVKRTKLVNASTSLPPRDTPSIVQYNDLDHYRPSQEARSKYGRSIRGKMHNHMLEGYNQCQTGIR